MMRLKKGEFRPEGREREFVLVGDHSARCRAGKHEDWQHGVSGCAVGPEGSAHCDCTARWKEAV